MLYHFSRAFRPAMRRLAVWSLLSVSLFYAGPVRAFSLGAGLAAVEEGDDRLRPAAVLHAGWNENYMSNLLFYGRSYQNVNQKTAMISCARRAAVPGFKVLKASFGLFLLDESTSIDGLDPSTGKPMTTENSISGGIAFGLEAHLLQIGSLSMRAAWESYLVPAGIDGGILLATGRKQVFSLVLGGGL